MKIITPIVQKLLGYPIVTVPSEFGFRPDGIIVYPGAEDGKIPLLVMEAKNEVGTGGSDPNIQAAFSFRKLWSYLEVRFLLLLGESLELITADPRPPGPEVIVAVQVLCFP